ncbi:MAG: DUF1385 domain-containing protein [Ruminococcaceae bacterium]|nr:DUF1385 domain-containing protein [Oscillospiraceae bacterium]
MSCKKTSIGGQALIEGIMMRGPKKTVMAVRKKDGSIETINQNFSNLKDKCFLFKWPVIRGVVGFIESMTVGYKAMMQSAEISGYLDEETADRKENEKPKKSSSALMSVLMTVATVLAVVLCVVLFLWLPEKGFEAVNFLASLAGLNFEAFRSVFVGIIKILIFFAYMIAVSYMKDIKRVFSFHGAEHKTIFCYEAGEELTVENVRKQKRFHPRCGTSFMMLMLVVSICVTLLLDIVFPALTADNMVWLRILIKLPLIPIICGIGYELIKICGRYDNFITRIIAAPGLWFQRITVKEPDDSMIEVAIAAMKEVIPENEDEDKW